MKWFRKYGNRREEIKRAKKEFYAKASIIGVIVVFLALAFLLAQVQKFGKSSQREVALQQKNERSHEETIAYQNSLREEFALLEMEISQAKKNPELLDKEISLLAEAIDLQKKIISNRVSEIPSKNDTEMLEKLNKEYDTILSEDLYHDSLVADQKAQALYLEGKHELALESLKVALAKQKEIDQNHSKSPYRNVFRSNQIKNEISLWSTKPQADRVDQLIEESMILSKNHDSQKAIKLAKAAVELQKDLNQNYRESIYASIGRLKKAENHLVEVSIADSLGKIKLARTNAENAFEQKNIELAESEIDAAIATADKIIAMFPSKKTQLTEMKNDLWILKETISSYSLSQSIESLNQDLRKYLKEQNGQKAASILPELFRQSDRMRRFFPRSKLFNQEIYEQAKKLYVIKDSILTVVDFLKDNTKEIKGIPHVKLLISEAPQSLLNLIGVENRSLTKHPNSPVDSISAEETKKITEILSWVTQSEVRLPTREEFIAAIGSHDKIQRLARTSWNSQNSDGETKVIASSPPNDEGFFDLLGNVSEWVSNREGDFITIGGSSRDNPLRLAEIPEIDRHSNERSRFVGFRFVIVNDQ